MNENINDVAAAAVESTFESLYGTTDVTEAETEIATTGITVFRELLEDDSYEIVATAPHTAVYPEAGTGSIRALAYVALGLAGEAGEVSNKVKKILRDGASVEGITDELGDVLWYLNQMCLELGTTLAEVSEKNTAKLLDRKMRGVIGGSGDNR